MATDEILFQPLPPHRLRANPRVFKRKMSRLRGQALGASSLAEAVTRVARGDRGPAPAGCLRYQYWT